MLTKKRQKEYLGKQFKTLSASPGNYRESGNAEELHRLRVAVKKIRALVFLQEKCGSEISTRPVHALKVIFDHAGTIRSGKINLALLRRYRLGGTGAGKKLALRVEQEQKSFKAKALHYQKEIAKAKKKISGGISGIKEKSVTKLLEKDSEKAIVFLQKHFTESGLHNCRKKLKRILYIHTMLPAKMKKKNGADLSYLHNLQELIGQWHDATEFSRLLAGAGLKKGAVLKKSAAKSKAILIKISGMLKDVRKKMGQS
ncbi:MAG: hypothetical protein FD123_3503 [Bacteroidetes bacterium]|nr:MAG: hypothetical protein FD123_3503 [Bacteroidota bacterium]